MSGLRVDDARVTYPGTPPVEAVRGVSLAVAAGEIVALLGPSGCGKSSLLSAVVGVTPLAGGTVAWDGEDLARVPVHRRGFGLVFQDGQLFPHLTVGANVAFGLEMAGVPRGSRESRVAELLAMVGLEGLGGRSVTELSGGQRQRVALARSLASRPRLLALDEPLSSLDADLRGRLAVEVRDLLRATGTTGLLVTHDPAEASVMADRVLRMEDGLLV
ncbi:ABC transporter ATP-binding protein [Demequina phytophila]|uniref:ABC transporter ATP-binding protein n=1 Tax=Demequina phytophila TaxID=1638981 RepID=UPI0007823259|nr:ABC transporter ATP-binding protein [Demequina phytophila]